MDKPEGGGVVPAGEAQRLREEVAYWKLKCFFWEGMARRAQEELVGLEAGGRGPVVRGAGRCSPVGE